MTTHYINPDTQLTGYMVFPRFLLDLPVSETAKLLYMILLDRTRLSCRDPVWHDPQDRVYVHYPVKQLAEKLGKGKTAIADSLNALEKHRLIDRKHQGIGKASRIYVLCPGSNKPVAIPDIRTSEIPETGKTEITSPDKQTRQDRFSGGLVAGKAAGNKNNISKNKGTKMRSKKDCRPYGRYLNVFLSGGDIDMLKEEAPDWRQYVDRLSFYMKSSGKEYKDHAATILQWAERDKRETPSKETWRNKDYSYKEGESL